MKRLASRNVRLRSLYTAVVLAASVATTGVAPADEPSPGTQPVAKDSGGLGGFIHTGKPGTQPPALIPVDTPKPISGRKARPLADESASKASPSETASADDSGTQPLKLKPLPLKPLPLSSLGNNKPRGDNKPLDTPSRQTAKASLNDHSPTRSVPAVPSRLPQLLAPRGLAVGSGRSAPPARASLQLSPLPKTPALAGEAPGMIINPHYKSPSDRGQLDRGQLEQDKSRKEILPPPARFVGTDKEASKEVSKVANSEESEEAVRRELAQQLRLLRAAKESVTKSDLAVTGPGRAKASVSDAPRELPQHPLRSEPSTARRASIGDSPVPLTTPNQRTLQPLRSPRELAQKSSASGTASRGARASLSDLKSAATDSQRPSAKIQRLTPFASPSHYPKAPPSGLADAKPSSSKNGSDNQEQGSKDNDTDASSIGGRIRRSVPFVFRPSRKSGTSKPAHVRFSDQSTVPSELDEPPKSLESRPLERDLSQHLRSAREAKLADRSPTDRVPPLLPETRRARINKTPAPIELIAPAQSPVQPATPAPERKPDREFDLAQFQNQPAEAGEPPETLLPAVPADDDGFFEVIDQAGELMVQVRRSKLLRTDRKVYRTAVVDPQICDVLQFTPQEVSVIGKATGATHVTFWFEGADRPVTYLVRVTPDVEAQATEERNYQLLEDLIADLFPDSKVQLVLLADKLLVRGQAKDAEEATQILAIVRTQASNSLGSRPSLTRGYASPVIQAEASGRPENGTRFRVINMLRVPGVQQVALRVKIAELNRSAARGFGVDASARVNFSPNPEGSALFLQSLLNATTGSAPALLSQFDGDDIQVGIRWLSQHGILRLVSEPTLVTMSGKPATFVAGGEFAVPTVVGSAGLNAVTTDFRAFGVIVSFVPTVVDKDRIRLQVAPEFSQINNDLGVGGTPGLNVRAVTTTVEMREGQTLAIAGLLEDSLKATRTGDLPLLSRIFGRRDASRSETELIILVTPELVHPMDPEEVPPLPGFDVTEPNNHEFYLKGNIEGNSTNEYRSTVWPRLRKRYKSGGPAMISGPFGHGQ